jgi:hypothetical protein
MNRFFYFLYLLIFVCSSQLFGQQNLFNIPSGDITPKGKFFYQHQFNFYSANELESKSHIVYGAGKGWDLGVNFVDLPLSFGQGGRIVSFNDNSKRKPLYPLLMFTLQKQFVLKAEHWFINVGTQIGPNLSNEFSNKRIAAMNYALIRWQPSKKGYLIAGPYHTNDVFVGGPPKNNFGLMFGYEYRLNDKWLLMADFISGSHKKSQTVIGGGYNVSHKLQLFLGGLLAFPNNKLDNGVVLEINWYGSNFMDAH